MVCETRLSLTNLIYPLFVCPGKTVKREITSMPGNFNLSIDQIVEECHQVSSLGIPAVLLFGIPTSKDKMGASAYDENGIVPSAVRAIKLAEPHLLVITDVCLCGYTDHGHCGVLHNGDVDNDATLDLLAKTALVHARAGADLIAPSDMMDGRVAAIREILDSSGFEQTPILSYAAKYASAFYGPFREAASSAPKAGDRKSYQMDPGNQREAIREVALDIEEGADIIMVKPAMPYLDIIFRVKSEFSVPVAAYQVSGEYASLTAAHKNGWLDQKNTIIESLTCIKRAGADWIITYFAKIAAQYLR
ncbi:MAG: porphobilinogen synthase [Acidobacteriia bacterium]|nr:porphobilinogen synthase [Terriglobia bacterium]